MKNIKEDTVIWIKKHRKELIWAGVSLATLIGIVFVLKNEKNLRELRRSLEKMVKPAEAECAEQLTQKQCVEPLFGKREYTIPKMEYEVKQHIRMLPEGMHHSQKKAEEAALMGIELLPNQTLVDPYMKYAA